MVVTLGTEIDLVKKMGESTDSFFVSLGGIVGSSGRQWTRPLGMVRATSEKHRLTLCRLLQFRIQIQVI